MDKFNILECTLRDGGYITGWHFEKKMMADTVRKLIEANLDFVEVGYLNHKLYEENTSQFNNIEQISEILPSKKERENTVIIAMADVQQFLPEDLTPFSGKSIDGIRVVFYKHQIEEALKMCEAVSKNGYKLFVQPMVTIDYTVDEYASLIARVKALKPYAVSIVDSFGYMIKSDFRNYFKILDNLLPPETIIGFHSHNNMNLAFITAQDILEYQTTRRLVIDSSLYGMGRGAGNLNTELICNYYNKLFGDKYNINKILSLISDYIMPINQKTKWGYSPYMFITGLYHYHPNFACYLLDEYEVSVSEFSKFLLTIPEDMKTKCKKPYVLEMYKKFKESGN
ncbi:MAG: aldolase catalytic domain-containing protein [Treponemataceae bacterium]|nr:aldolase catalytic domain-containing protein [Treponemataceae bacterium]